jgi:hypothetical protein
MKEEERVRVCAQVLVLLVNCTLNLPRELETLNPEPYPVNLNYN